MSFRRAASGVRSTSVARYTDTLILEGHTGVRYVVNTIDQVDENIRTCNVVQDKDLLLDRRFALMLERDWKRS